MNNHQTTTTSASDFRFLNINSVPDRYQIELGLGNMGCSPEAIRWFFTQFDNLKADYTKELASIIEANEYDSKHGLTKFRNRIH